MFLACSVAVLLSAASPNPAPVCAPLELEVPSRLTEPPIARATPLPAEEDWKTQVRKDSDGRWRLARHGMEETLTVVPRLNEALERILLDYQTPYAAVVVLEPRTGRVLAMADHSEEKPSLNGLALRAIYPAASIFKIVTASALLKEGVTPDAEACFHGGKRRLSERLLKDSARDQRCYSLALAMGKSANVVFAKMTARHLSPAKLLGAAHAFYFNRPFSFPYPVDVSLAGVPEDEFGLSNTGAGFGDVFLSPLHGAAIAAAIANRGLWRPPVFFESGLLSREDAPQERVMTTRQAEALTQMLEKTVTEGTARGIFRQRGYRVKDAVGKTGSLADRNPFRDYSWFVGFAPKEDPKVAVAAVVVNNARWRIRATWLGREAMRLYLDQFAKEAPQASFTIPESTNR